MDRWDHGAAADTPADTNLRKALDVIRKSYDGAQPEAIFQDATRCFESLIEISLGSEAVVQFARKYAVDPKYLIDGANHVISRLHFNTKNNHFLTLGLPQTASAEEIRQRWKRLMMLYHPDRHEGNPEWVEARAKKVNEAYSELKDDTKRIQYLARLSDEERSAGAAAHRRQAGPEAAPLRHRQFPNRRARSAARRGRPSFWKTTLPNLPKIMIVLYILAALFVLWTISRENRSAVLESELNRAEPTLPAPSVPLSPSPAEGPASENLQAPSPAVSARTLPAPPAQSQPTAPSTGTFRPKTLPEKAPLSRQETTLRSQLPAPAASPAETEAVAEARHAAPLPEPSRPEPLPAAPEKPRTAALPEPTVPRSEVEEFMQRYIRCYNTNDYNGFMALFSPNAVENSLNYSQIRSAYRAAFSEKINQYAIQDMTIRPERDGAVVSGTYVLSSYSSRENRWMRFRGKITWNLIRDNGSLRIAGIRYDQ